jgi:hypothetical protein
VAFVDERFSTMNLADILRFALHALTAHRLRTFLSASGVAVGIAAVILLTSIGEGIHRFVLAEFTQFGTNIVNISPGTTTTHGGSVGAIGSAGIRAHGRSRRSPAAWSDGRLAAFSNHRRTP